MKHGPNLVRRRLISAPLLALAAACRSRDAAAERTVRVDQDMTAGTPAGLAVPACRPRIDQVRGDWRRRPRLGTAVRRRPQDGRLPRALRVPAGADGRRQHLRRAGVARRLSPQVRGALSRAARGRRAVPGGARQPRRSRAALLSRFQHGRPAVLHVRAAGPACRPTARSGARLRHRQHQPRRRATGLAGTRTRTLTGALEDLHAPPPAVHRRPLREHGAC